MTYEEYGKIISAALLKDNCIYISKKGHHAIFPMEAIGVLRDAEQGFVTENGCFVDRIVGLDIAKHFNQLITKQDLNELYSEYLKKENSKILNYKTEYKYRESNDLSKESKILKL